jgi:hypothetical protein
MVKTVTRTSRIRGVAASEGTAEQIQAAFEHYGRIAARDWYKRPFRPIPPTLGRDIVSVCQEMDIEYDGGSGMVSHETGWWQSDVAQLKRNPAGLGAENDNAEGTAFEKAITFDSDYAGLRAWAAHLRTYTDEDNPYKDEDPRYGDTPVASRGAAEVWWHLEQRWAWSDPADYAATPIDKRYGAGIASRANQVLRMEVPMSAQIPRFTWVPDLSGEIGYPPGTTGRRDPTSGITYEPDVLVVHITEGTDSLGWLNGKNGNSAHLLTWPNGAPRTQMVDIRNAAWAAGSRLYNLRGIQLEHEKKRAVADKKSGWSQEEYNNLALIAADVIRACPRIVPEYVGKSGKPGIMGHYDVPDPDGTGWGGDGNHVDPCAGFEWGRFIPLVQQALDPVMPNPTNPNGLELVTPYDATIWIVNQEFPDGWVPMLDGFVAAGGVEDGPGFPLAGMRQDADGVYRQPCENGMMEVWPHGWGSRPGPHWRMGGVLHHVEEYVRLKAELEARTP